MKLAYLLYTNEIIMSFRHVNEMVLELTALQFHLRAVLFDSEWNGPWSRPWIDIHNLTKSSQYEAPTGGVSPNALAFEVDAGTELYFLFGHVELYCFGFGEMLWLTWSLTLLEIDLRNSARLRRRRFDISHYSLERVDVTWLSYGFARGDITSR
jgi:hypothetical protein